MEHSEKGILMSTYLDLRYRFADVSSAKHRCLIGLPVKIGKWEPELDFFIFSPLGALEPN